MKFEQALDQMQEGARVKLPEWKGYWYWDDILSTIIIHNKDGSQLDIRETTTVDFTLRNVAREDWELMELPKETEVETEVEDPFWWEEVDFAPDQPRVLRRGDRDAPGDTEGPVRLLQAELNRVGANLTLDGDYGPGTERAVRNFQQRVGLVADGIFGDKTAAALDGHPFPETLKQEDLEWAAEQLQCEVATIMAISHVESRGRGFFPSGRPAVLFERHWMRRRLNHHGIDYKPHMRQHPDLVNTRAGGYKGGEIEHDRIERAARIHETSALESASWAAYQIMGFHWKALGYDSVQHYVAEMSKGERQHLEAFVKFNLIDPVLLKAIREKDFLQYALRYNGPKQKGYDKRMRDAYNDHKKAGF